jgi:predicted permease
LVFFKSPVFFALIIGSLWGYLRLPGQNNEFMAPIFKVCNVLASALTPLAILSVGLMFKLPHLRKMIGALTIVILLKLIFKPLIAGYLATLFGFPELWKEVLVLLAAMPPAVLGAVFLRRYGGDASLASTLLLGGTMASAASLLPIFEFIG